MNTTNKTVETNVLYQKLGNTWFAFTEIDGETLFYTFPEGFDPRGKKFQFEQIIHSEEKSSYRELVA